MTKEGSTVPPIPGETGRRARAVFGNSNFYLRLGDGLPTLLPEVDRGLWAADGDYHFLPVPVHAFVTFFQLVEELSDVQASDALRTRVEWQYALHLPPNHGHLHEEELCFFRQSLIGDTQKIKAFHDLVRQLASLGGFCAGQAYEGTGVEPLTAVCLLNRLNWGLQAMHELLGVLASRRGEWLSDVARPHWYASYWADRPIVPGAVCCAPAAQLATVGARLGDDVHYLLEALTHVTDLNQVETLFVKNLRRVWRQQFEMVDGAGEGRRVSSAMSPRCSFCGRPGTVDEEGA